MTGLASGLTPPYFAVIFTSKSSEDQDGYADMAARMVELAATQPGFLGIDSARGPDGVGVTVSYWADEDAIKSWKNESKHLLAQKLGRERWYDRYELRVAKVERAYSGPDGRG